jgi:hypothetical protein
MPDAPPTWLLTHRLRDLAEQIAAAPDDGERERLWAEADRVLGETDAEEDADLALPVWERELAGLTARLAAWDAGRAPLPEWDKAVLKRAFKAYKKRLKLMRLDDESTAGVNPLSAGRESSILGIRPPDQYPPEVWALLVAQGKLRDAGGGLLELATV